MCITDATASGTQATVGANWSVIQTNIDGALTTAMLGWHTVIGIGEAVITFLAVSSIIATRPDLVHGAGPARRAAAAARQSQHHPATEVTA